MGGVEDLTDGVLGRVRQPAVKVDEFGATSGRWIDVGDNIFYGDIEGVFGREPQSPLTRRRSTGPGWARRTWASLATRRRPVGKGLPQGQVDRHLHQVAGHKSLVIRCLWLGKIIRVYPKGI